jgi:transcription initiation protein SPT3
VLKAALLAQRKGSKSISQDDLMFVVRKDTAKLVRLREFLNWKDVRKNVKQAEETNAANAAATIPFDVDGVADEEEEAETASVSAAPAKIKLSQNQTRPLTKKRAHYYWDCLAGLVADASDGQVLDMDPVDLDEQLEDVKEEGLRRLRDADRITRSMSKIEYMEYTECRQASFTYKKAKKFRDWLGIPLSVTEYRLSDEVLEILGFLAAEIVRQLTEGALRYRETEPLRTDGGSSSCPVVGLFRAPQQKSAVRPEHVSRYLQELQSHNEPLRNRIKLY